MGFRLFRTTDGSLGLGDGFLSIGYRHGAIPAGSSIGLVCAISPRTAIWVQHHDPKIMVVGPIQRIAVRHCARFPVSGAGAETVCMERTMVVVVDLGRTDRVPIDYDGAGAGIDTAPVQ